MGKMPRQIWRAWPYISSQFLYPNNDIHDDGMNIQEIHITYYEKKIYGDYMGAVRDKLHNQIL